MWHLIKAFLSASFDAKFAGWTKPFFWLGEARQSLSLSSKMFSEAVSRKPNLAPSVRESGARLETLLKADFRTFWLLKVVRLFQSGNKGSTLSQELANGCGRTWRSLMWLKMTPVKF
jgi:hypothetical protein